MKTPSLQKLTNEEFFYGHKGCGGCGEALAIRLAIKILGKKTFVSVPAGCMSAVGFIYPNMAFTTNAIITPFASTASIASGIAAGLDALGIKDTYSVGFAGDGGTADIGLQSLSGAIDRKDNIIYFCTDNEAYMNTGIQESSLTPYAAHTTTSPTNENFCGCMTSKKSMFEIIASHHISYAATASIGSIQDFLKKVETAKQTKGPSYIHVLTPCPTGWGYPTNLTVSIAKEAVDCGLWYLAEYKNSTFTLNKNPKSFSSIKNYLLKQKRFKHLGNDDISYIEKLRNEKWEQIRKQWIH